MPWLTLNLEGKRLYGIDNSYFGALKDSIIEASENTDEGRRFISARDKLRIDLLRPKYLGGFSAEYGVTSFFDDLADNASLTNDIQLALAFGYAWFRYTHDSQSPGDIDDVRAERILLQYSSMLEALTASVPVTLGATDKTDGRPVVRALSLAMDTGGRRTFLDSDGGI